MPFGRNCQNKHTPGKYNFETLSDPAASLLLAQIQIFKEGSWLMKRAVPNHQVNTIRSRPGRNGANAKKQVILSPTESPFIETLNGKRGWSRLLASQVQIRRMKF